MTWIERPTVTIDVQHPIDAVVADMPDDVIAAGRSLLAAVSREIPAKARLIADLVRWRTGNRFQRETVAYARRVGAAWRDVLLANISYDLMLAHLGCSTMALATRDGPVLARNMDWWPERELAQSSYLFRAVRGESLAWLNAGFPGSVGVVTALSGRGFALALNAVLSPEGSRLTGYPMLLFLRRVIEDAADFAAAERLLCRTKLASPGLITLVGTENDQRVVIERTPTRHAVRRANGNEPLITTNDYRLLYPPESSDQGEIYRTTCQRYEALGELVVGGTANQVIGDEQLLYWLTDRRVLQQITAQHIVLRPRQKTGRLYVPRRLLDDSPVA